MSPDRKRTRKTASARFEVAMQSGEIFVHHGRSGLVGWRVGDFVVGSEMGRGGMSVVAVAAFASS